ncbi:MAG: glycosyltransferase family 2 protein [Desulfuromonas sp.]|nr:glycosyltransferase family 2 protein [Desulfuromonas sp.]
MSQSLDRYLRQRQLDGPWHIEGDLKDGCRGVVIIPSLGEGEQLWATLNGLAANALEQLRSFLVVVIINGRPDSNGELLKQNELDLAELRSGRCFGALQMVWIDAGTAQKQLPGKRGGVGMARKIAGDLILPYLQDDGLMIHLDADTLVDKHYLQAITNSFLNAKHGAAVIPYCHQSGADAGQSAAMVQYELYLRSHVLGLQLAASPYAYHCIGSTMVCTRQAYIKAGGMNCRLAGEDFYFMQQLTKTSGTGFVTGTVVRPAARISERTPFGTGQVVRELSANRKASQLFYAPQCYGVLEDWLTLVRNGRKLSADELIRQAEPISPALVEFLDQEQFQVIWERLRKTHQQAARRQRAFDEWFDALKTMRCIHYLSAHAYPMAGAEQHVPPLLQQINVDSGDSPEEWLALLRQRDNCVV